MQKSKKMMVSLCGLALSSLFVLNNKAVVHADTVDGTQNNAISWNSDSDAAQNVQNTQKADDNQQNAAQPMQSRAETSTVRSSSAAPRTTNQNTVVQSPKISNINDAQAAVPVVINNPANNKVHVHYVKTDGTSVGTGDYDIKLNNQGTGSYNTPKDYQLINPNGKYTVDLVKYTGTVASGDGGSITNPDNNHVQVQFVDENGNTVGTDSINIVGKTGGTYSVPSGYVSNGDNRYSVSSTSEQVPTRITMYRDADNVPTQDINLSQSDMEKLWDFIGHRTTFTVQMAEADQDNRVISVNNKQLPSYESWGRHAENAFNKYCKYGLQHQVPDFEWVDMGGAKARFRVSNKTTYKFHDDSHTVDGDTVTVRVHKDSTNRFIDNSGNVQSVNGNTVNVVLTKPQSVNPATDTRCHSQATRTIQINFPGGQVPQSYDGIVDKSGKLVQTVHFTRTATEDALTGNILQYGNWTSDNQDHNFIGFEARTLPRIPGYTLSIKPAQA